jgi:hypothetical protein
MKENEEILIFKPTLEYLLRQMELQRDLASNNCEILWGILNVKR